MDDGSQRATAGEIDSRLHAERLDPDRSKRTFTKALDELPDGVFVTLGVSGSQAYLVWGDGLLPWSPGGYAQPRHRLQGVSVSVLTPPSTVAAIRAGYVPDVHASARR